MTADGAIQRADLLGGPPAPLSGPAAGREWLVADGTSLYWVEGKRLFAMAESGGAPTAVAELDAGVTAMTRCAAGLFWASQSGMLQHLRGQAVTTVASGVAATALACDRTHVFWTAPDNVGRIPLAGGDKEVLHRFAPDGSSLGLGLAVDEQRVYWIEASGHWQTPTGRLVALPKIGGTPTYLAAGLGWSLMTAQVGQFRQMALVVDETAAYWADPREGTVQRVPTQNEGVAEAIAPAEGIVVMLSESAEDLYWVAAAKPGGGGDDRVHRTPKRPPGGSPSILSDRLGGVGLELVVAGGDVLIAVGDGPYGEHAMFSIVRVDAKSGEQMAVALGSYPHALTVADDDVYWAGRAARPADQELPATHWNGQELIKNPRAGVEIRPILELEAAMATLDPAAAQQQAVRLLPPQKVAASEEDGGRLSVVADRATVFWTTRTAVRALPRTGGHRRDVAGVGGYGLVGDDRTLYWIDGEGGLRSVVKEGGAEPRTIMLGLAAGSTLALDDEHVYCADPKAGAIVRIAKDTGAKLLLAGEQQGATSLKVLAGALYWLSGPQVRRALMTMPASGGAPQPVRTGGGGLVAFAVDGANVYWTTASGKLLMRPR